MYLADADFFIGFISVQDAHHKRSREIVKKLEEQVITSWDVIDEVITKLSYNVSREKALEFIDKIEKEETMIVYPTSSLFLKAVEILKKQTLKHVSLTDCMNMAIAREKKIDKFLSFDRIYEKNGFHLLK